MILIDAVYISGGGALKLLELLLESLPAEPEITILVDKRPVLPRTNGRVIYGEASERFRKKFYRDNMGQIQRALCFSNVPPPVRLACPTKTYFHNRLLAEPPSLSGGIPPIVYRIKSAYIWLRRRNTDCFVVQTPTMRDACMRAFGLGTASIEVTPFFRDGQYAYLAGCEKTRDAFGFVSWPLLHKGHDQLLRVWASLLDIGVTPELHLTIPYEHPLAKRVGELAARGARIFNHGITDPSVIYRRCFHQIFPSSSESFGLGLVEAAEAGCRVIAPDLAYVDDVIAPSLRWIHGSDISMQAAILRSLSEELPPSRVTVKNQLPSILSFLRNP